MNCAACGAELPAYGGRGRPRMFCDAECSREFWLVERRKPQLAKVCEECEGQFASARADQRFCSDRCGRRWWRRESDAGWGARPEEYRARHAKRLAEHPGRAAHQEVARAVRAGKLTRDPCEVCGEAKSQAHHEDYSRPLDVTWLCARHHMTHHLQEVA